MACIPSTATGKPESQWHSWLECGLSHQSQCQQLSYGFDHCLWSLSQDQTPSDVLFPIQTCCISCSKWRHCAGTPWLRDEQSNLNSLQELWRCWAGPGLWSCAGVPGPTDQQSPTVCNGTPRPRPGQGLSTKAELHGKAHAELPAKAAIAARAETVHDQICQNHNPSRPASHEMTQMSAVITTLTDSVVTCRRQRLLCSFKFVRCGTNIPAPLRSVCAEEHKHSGSSTPWSTTWIPTRNPCPPRCNSAFKRPGGDP